MGKAASIFFHNFFAARPSRVEAALCRHLVGRLTDKPAAPVSNFGPFWRRVGMYLPKLPAVWDTRP